MTRAPVSLRDLRRRIYAKAKAEPSWRFWGLYVHVCKMETLQEAYSLAKKNNGAPGIDGVTFEAIEESDVMRFLEQIQDELATRKYRPTRNRRKEIPKDGGKKVRVLGIPTIRDRVVQGALRLILEPIFEADFQPGSFGYRPKRTAHAAVDRIAVAIVKEKTLVLDVDLKAYFDNVRHHLLLAKVAARVNDPDVMHLLKMMLKASGTKGVPQGGVISPLLSNIYLNDVDRMLERAKEVTRRGQYTYLEYARYADDLVVLVEPRPHVIWTCSFPSSSRSRFSTALGSLTRDYPQKLYWKAAFRGSPAWMRTMVYVFCGYAMINFLLFAVSGGAETGPPDAVPAHVVRGFSGHWMAFFSVSTAMLYSAGHAEESDDRRRCLQGHRMQEGMKYCGECGSPVASPL